MATTCELYLDDIDAAYAASLWCYDSGKVYKTWLINNYQSWSSFNLTWRTNVALSISWLYGAIQHLTYGNTIYYPPLRIPYYLRNCAGGTFDMDTLLSTMLGATPEQVTYFIGLEDAYRQSIWNKPFNSEFFAALARGFQEWP